MRATILATAGLLAIATPAGALFDTKTNGYICTNHCPDYSFGTFSAQTFKGATRPSRSDQTVNFYYRREGTNEWHRFGREDPEGTSPAFKSLDGHAHAHIKNDNRWRFEFSAYKEGRWVLMAKFVRQDGYAASSVRRHVTVHYSE
jgi:hypothetical protein